MSEMNQRRVWHPEASYTPSPQAAQLGSEESGRGSLQASSHTSASESEQETGPGTKRRSKQVIPRRRTPTVCIPPARPLRGRRELTSTPSPSTEAKKPAYKTMESSKGHTRILLEQSSKIYRQTSGSGTTPPSKQVHNWFCGWTDHEHLDMYRSNRLVGGTAVEHDGRSTLQTPAEGSRASSSRYVSSQDGRRVFHYVFHHYLDVKRHIQKYRELYSYTALNISPSHLAMTEQRAAASRGDSEQDYEDEVEDEVLLPFGLNPGDPHLCELMRHLGIRDVPPMVNWETQRQQLPRPTPPSIFKRRGQEREVEIVISNSAPKRSVAILR